MDGRPHGVVVSASERRELHPDQHEAAHFPLLRALIGAAFPPEWARDTDARRLLWMARQALRLVRRGIALPDVR